MPPRKRRDVEAGLLTKGFQPKEGDHHFFTYHRLTDDKKTSVFTKTSHSDPEIDDYLIGKMAKQCRLSRKDFLLLVDCPLERTEYEQKLVASGAIVPAGSNAED